jgi:glutamine synthetase
MVDTANVTRVKTIPIGRFEDAARFGVGISRVFTVPMVDDSFAESPEVHGPSGDLRLVPDARATIPLAAMPGWAWAPVDQYTQDGEPWAACARTFLRRMIGRLGAHGIELRGAIEHEFFAARRQPTATLGTADPEGDPVPAHRGPGYSAEVLTEHAGFGLSMIDALEQAGIGVQQFHPEYTTGQFEVSVSHDAALGAADTAVATRQTIRSVARAHGLDVSFAPVVYPGLVGNGAHLHFSVWNGDANLFVGGRGPQGMTRKGEAFSAGVLRELPAMLAIIAPSVPSYERLQPHHWAGAFTAWGYENREASLRFITGMVGGREAAANMELKCVDGAANPYLVFGAVIAAGLAGIEDKLTLPEGTTEDPDSLSAKEKRARGIRRLPTSLGDAVKELEASTVLRDAMGELLHRAFIATRQGEDATYRDMDLIDAVRAHRWRY